MLHSCSQGPLSQPALKSVFTLTLTWPTEVYAAPRYGTRGGIRGAAVVSRWHGGDSLGQSGKEDLNSGASFPRACKEGPKLYSNKRELLLSGGCPPRRCLFCTIGLTSSFIAPVAIQISISVFARAAIADQHPSPAPFPGPWGTGCCHCRQGCGQQRVCAHTCGGRGHQPLPVLTHQPVLSSREKARVGWSTAACLPLQPPASF